MNRTLRFILENTTYAKIMVVTRKNEDIEDMYKIGLEIKDLSRLNGARLLLTVAG